MVQFNVFPQSHIINYASCTENNETNNSRAAKKIIFYTKKKQTKTKQMDHTKRIRSNSKNFQCWQQWHFEIDNVHYNSRRFLVHSMIVFFISTLNAE